MDATKEPRRYQPDRCLATGVELWLKGDGTLNWCDDQCAICGGEHIYPAGDQNDPRRALGPQTPACATPEPGTPLAIASEAINLGFGNVVLFDLEPLDTVEILKGLLEPVGDGDDVGVDVDGVVLCEVLEMDGIQTGAAQPPPLTRSEVAAAFKQAVLALHGPDFTRAEACVLPAPPQTGCFTTVDSLVEAATEIEMRTTSGSLFVSVNPVALQARLNRDRILRGHRPTDPEIARLRNWFLDFDPSRSTDTAATNAEKELARVQMETARVYFAGLGFGAPIVADSGNGYHLHFLVDLPNDDRSRQLLKSATAKASAMFSTPAVKLDVSVSNPARLTRLYGGVNRKGTPTPERPWRRTSLIDTPAERVPVTGGQLTSFIQDGSTAAPTGARTPQDWRGDAPTRFSMDAFIDAEGIHVRNGPHDYQGGQRWLITCPLDSSHDRGETALFIDSVGMAGFHCWHASCQEFRGWSRFTAELKSRQPDATNAGGDLRNLERFMIPDMHNDYGNAERFKVRHGDDVRFCHGMRRWFIWDGARWCMDEKQEAYKLAALAMVESLRQATRAGNGEAVKFAKLSLDARRIDNLLRLAQSDLAISPQEIDLNPWLLNFKNGTFDFQAGKLREHRREDLITKLNDYNFDAAAQAPTFQKVLERVTRGAEGLRPYLQQALGYSLTGKTGEKAFFICYGPSGTGKTTLLTAVRNAFPEYSTNLQVETLMAKSGGLDNNAQSDLADLRGMRFAQTSETEQGQRLKEGQLKRLTQGTGMIKAARKYENLVQFPESHKLWMDANHLPTIRDGTGIFERLHCIPFRNVITETEQNTNIHADLEAERAGIAAWVVQGALDWMRAGRLVRPPVVQAEGREYQESQDSMADWIAECCVTGEDAEGVSTEALRSSFNDFASRTGDRTLSQTHFKERMAARGFKYQRSKGLRFFVGIGLATRKLTEFMAA